MSPILSHFQVKSLQQAQLVGKAEAETTLDLGRTTAVLNLHPTHIALPDGQTLTWEQLAEITKNELACYLIHDNTIEKVHFFSESLQRYYSLMPTEGAPTMLISGFPMHRIKDTEPHQDTLSKIKAIAPVTGIVLDTTMGLGYTAIEAAKTAESVTTLELDPTVLEVCRCNPWSQGLFNNPKITQITADAYDWVTACPNSTFSVVLHDPPTFSLAGDLYSADFYRQLVRILKPKGRLFHYIGDPKSKSGANVTKGVVRRLQEAGFRRIVPKPEAFGVAAFK